MPSKPASAAPHSHQRRTPSLHPRRNGPTRREPHRRPRLLARYAADSPLPLEDHHPRTLDLAFTHWTTDPTAPADKPSADLVATALGSAFDQYLVEHCGVRWITLTDNAGTSWAIEHPAAAVTAFPIESVRKRIERRETNFFDSIALILQSQINKGLHGP